MIRTKLKLLAQTTGFAVIGLLVIYGGLNVFRNAERAWGAAPLAAGAAPVLQLDNTGVTTPTFLNYQGMLRDTEGTPLSGLHTMTFRLYDRVSAPLNEAVWGETHGDVTVRAGQFSVLLGNSEPIPPALFHGPDMFIGVTVGDFDEMVPRQRFASVPYAMYADHAAALTAPNGAADKSVYVAPNGNVGVGTLDPQAGLHISATETMTSVFQVDAGNQNISMDGSGVGVNGIFTFRASPGVTNPRVEPLVSLNSDNALGLVGIGVEQPLRPLHIRGNDPDIFLDINTGDGAQNLAEIYFGQNGEQLADVAYNRINGDFSLRNRAGGAKVLLDAAGNVKMNTNASVSNNLAIGGSFTMDNRKPILIKRIVNQGENVNDISTGISANTYECTAAGWSTARMDMSEDSQDAEMVWTYVSGSTWRVKVKFMSDGPHEKPHVDVLCFVKGIVQYDGTNATRADNGE